MADFTFSTNAGQLAARMTARAAAFSVQTEAAMRQNLADMKRLAIEYSSGAAGRPDPTHPYSRKRPHPLLPPYIVNVGRGVFRAGWQTSLTREAGNLVGRLLNVDPKSVYFRGTGKMIARPILQNVLQRSRRPVFERNAAAVRKALRSA